MADFSSNTLVLDAILRELQLADDQNYRPLDGLTTISGDFAANRICFASNARMSSTNCQLTLKYPMF